MQITSHKQENEEHTFFIKDVKIENKEYNIEVKVRVLNKKVQKIIYASVENDIPVSQEEITPPSLKDKIIELIEDSL